MRKRFKKIFAGVAAAMLVGVAVVAVPWYGKSNGARMNFQDTVKFSKADLTAAGECVKQYFFKFRDCKLTDIWYDSTMDTYPVNYVETDSNGFIPKDTKGKDVLLLLSNYKTGPMPPEGLNDNNTYKNYEWWLVRNSAGEWRVVSCGYG